MNRTITIDEARSRIVESWTSDAPIMVEALLSDAPELNDDPAAVLELVRSELYMRERLDLPKAYHVALYSEYLARFAQFRAELDEEFAYINDMREAAPLFLTGVGPVPSIESNLNAEERETDREGARVFGDYVLIKEIGRGGMGVVYNAHQVSLDRPVALKLIRADRPATELEKQRFLDSAMHAAALEHPNIVPIYQVGEEHGELFLAMKLVVGNPVGDNLSAHIRRLRKDPRAAAQVVAQIARAIDYAH
jgi:hypothetical protein